MKKDIFYIRKYHYIKSEAELDLSSIAPLQRRRLSLADKIAFTVRDKVFDENICLSFDKDNKLVIKV